MHSANFTNQELSVCLDILYGSKRSSYGFVCSDTHYSGKNAIQIAGPKSGMIKVINKVTFLNTLLKNEQPGTKSLNFLFKSEKLDAEYGFSYPSSNGNDRLILVNERFATIFKVVLFHELLSSKAHWESFSSTCGYPKATL